MICPIKAREYPVDGQSIECTDDCAWLIERRCKHNKVIRMCAIAALAHKGSEPFRCWTNVFSESEVDE